MKSSAHINKILACYLLGLTACGGGSGTSSNPTDDLPVASPISSVPPTQPDDPLIQLNLPDTAFNYANITLPNHYTDNQFPNLFRFQRAAIELDNTPTDNPITDAGATLGRVLFYDTKLSANGTVSCASCHQQQRGFSDSESLSFGFDGGRTRRHSMGLANARFYFTGKFFWDERANTLEEQVLLPFQDPIEMGLVLEELEEIVMLQSYYPPMFEAAFGDEDVSSQRIALALAQFIRSMVSVSAKYDLARAEVTSATDDFPGFSALENQGKRLFFSQRRLDNDETVNCASCHISEAFVGSIPDREIGTTTATNNGLDLESVTDLGVFETTRNPRDTGKFKVPSLKNIAVTAPYMHDGRFDTLDEVIEHYSSGIQPHPNLANRLLSDDGNPLLFNFSSQEKQALEAFLHTLTDRTLLEDEKFSDPFN